MTEAAKIDVNLGAVQETLLIPLLGRAIETEKQGGLIDDPKAIEIVRSLNYDFEKWRGTTTMVGATVRTRMYDLEVQGFLAENPCGSFVEIWCCLYTRYVRLDNASATARAISAVAIIPILTASTRTSAKTASI